SRRAALCSCPATTRSTRSWRSEPSVRSRSPRRGPDAREAQQISLLDPLVAEVVGRRRVAIDRPALIDLRLYERQKPQADLLNRAERDRCAPFVAGGQASVEQQAALGAETEIECHGLAGSVR